MSNATELRAKARELLAAAATTHDLVIAMLLRDVAAEYTAEANAEERRQHPSQCRRA